MRDGETLGWSVKDTLIVCLPETMMTRMQVQRFRNANKCRNKSFVWTLVPAFHPTAATAPSGWVIQISFRTLICISITDSIFGTWLAFLGEWIGIKVVRCPERRYFGWNGRKAEIHEKAACSKSIIDDNAVQVHYDVGYHNYDTTPHEVYLYHVTQSILVIWTSLIGKILHLRTITHIVCMGNDSNRSTHPKNKLILSVWLLIIFGPDAYWNRFILSVGI